jgi:uncharacterized membrane protein HdeD (DUF308 family)
MTGMLEMAARNWWAFVLRGVVAILFGVMAWIWPGLTLTALVIIFGAYALVDGVFGVVAGIASYGESRRWWAELVMGVAGIIAGILTFLWPDVTALALLYLIAAWALVTGVLEIAAAIELRREIENEWLLAIGGLASIIFGLILIVRPGAGALGLLWLIGAYAVVFGALLIALGLRLRGMRGTSGGTTGATGGNLGGGVAAR